ncbi:hypothetical protein BDP55DRAFT_720395 [Colletotrichum godetiae]|uniref:Uncharacterized protein n=1 Tax=Colletotrichum godetiae TaxID=1209918 RepID=A0AAJ0A8Z4_9PEZI|nr:uncharacterized protein BDP55DRAFT_720395 [Colletotrichum godetiae]KAK1658731.1 hypothetical protein BDP55DRAFT_720395 [Colletotrichum godetiae]
MNQQVTHEIQPVGIDPRQLFYEPIVLEDALQKACRLGQEVFNGIPEVDNNSLATQAQVFHFFVNKLAQICDNRRGGETVSSVTVLDGPDGPEYLFASNHRDADELSETQEFAESLLTLVGKNPTGLKQKTLVKQVLWKILLFNLPRLNLYLKALDTSIDACIDDCRRRKAPETLMSELSKLKEKADFPRSLESESFQNKFLSDCEKLIKMALSMRNTEIEQAIRKNAKDGEMTSSKAWCDLRHYLGRLLSFRQAADAMIGTNERLPNLFQDFKFTAIPSGKDAAKPIARSRSFTATSIIKNMIPDDEEEQEFYLEQALEMQKFGLDDFIFRQISKHTFRPRVHAEVLVHSYLVSHDLQHPRDYFNSWKYIGSSKPTCRLCSYYFAAHPDRVQVRKSHFNLYPNWCLPGVFEGPNSGAPDAKTLHLLEKITERVHDDVKRTLDEKRPVGKNYDSNTHTSVPPGLPRYTHSDTASMGEAAIWLNEMSLNTRAEGDGHLPIEEGDDGYSMIGEVDDEAAENGS